MESDDLCLVWVGKPPGGCQPPPGGVQPPPEFVVPGRVCQAACLGDHVAVLTEEGKLGVISNHQDLVFLHQLEDQHLDLEDGGERDHVGGAGREQQKNGSLLGRIVCICKKEEEMCFLAVSQSGQVWKIVVEPALKVEKAQSPASDLVQLVHGPRHQMYIDTKNNVWSKGDVPYCGHLHSTASYLKIPYLTGHLVSQLQCGADFTACVATPKRVVSPDSPADNGASDQVDSSVKEGDPLCQQNSCPLGVKIASSSPLMKPGHKNATKHSISGSSLVSNKSTSSDSSTERPSPDSSLKKSSSRGVNDQETVTSSKDDQETVTSSKDDQDPSLVTTESAVSALEAEMQESSDASRNSGNPVVKLTATTSPPSKTTDFKSKADFNLLTADNEAVGRSSSPVSLDDIVVNLCGGKSSSEPPPSSILSEHDTTATRKRSSSLTLTVPSSEPQRQRDPAPPQYLLSSSKGKDFRGESGVGEAGEDLWQGEVWTWGEGGRGQLGQGDMLPRPNPVPVQGVHNQFILKLSVGSQHAVMLTGAGRVYGWGHNTSSQANPSDQLGVVLSPALVHLPKGEMARDVQAVGNKTLILCHSGNMYIAGQPKSSNKKQRLQCIPVSEMQTHQVSGRRQHPCSILAVPRGGQDHVYLVNTQPADAVVAGSRVAAAEKQLLDRIETVATLINQLHSGSPASGTVNKKWECETPLGEVWRWLKKGRNLISESVYLYHREARLLSQRLESRGSLLVRQIDAWLEICTELGYSIGSCVSGDLLMLDSDQSQHQHSIVSILLHQFGYSQQNIKGQVELEQLLLELYNINLPYIQVLEDVLPLKHAGSMLTRQCIASLKSLQQTLDRQKRSSLQTRDFWEGNTDSRLDSLRNAEQRVLLDSRSTPVSLASAFSTHRFILFSDILVDVGYNKISVHPLSTVWVDALPGSSQGSSSKHSINLTMPEGSKTMVCTSLDHRNTWLKALNEAVNRDLCRNRKTTYSSQAPITRTVKYSYTKGELRGCEYRGSMTQGRLQGQGRLCHPDSTVYTGGWRNDVKNGWGQLSLPNGTVKVGTWVDGKLTGSGRLKFPDGSEYCGDLVDGEPHGHGTMKSGRYVGDGTTMYTGCWSRGTRHGYGVLEDTVSGERYMGTWCEGLRQGNGCVVNSDGIYYEGTFTADKLTGSGIMIFEDGAVYEGEFCGAGEFYGNGTLTTRTEKFHGTFYGSYIEGMKFNGTVYRNLTARNTVADVPDGSFETSGQIQRHTVPNHDKWKNIFDKFEVMLSSGGKTAWENLSVHFHQNKLAHIEGRNFGDSTTSTTTRANGNNIKLKGFDSLETIPKVAKDTELTWSSYCDIAEYLVAANTCPVHPVNQVIGMLVNCFNASYGGLGSHPTLLPHAKDELKFVSWRLYSLFRVLFPALPPLQPGTQVWLSTATRQDRQQNGSSEQSCDASLSDTVILTPDLLLFPLLLPSIYPALFNLYIQKEDSLDREYWSRITRWNKHTDAALLTFFDVDTSAWELQIDRRSRDSVFLEAVYTLQRLKTTFTPSDKLDVIVAVFKAITAGTDNFTWNMDLLLPVCMYIVVRARVLQLGAELHMVNDFMEEHLRQGMEGITFTTLQAAYTQIRRESVFIN